MNEVLVQVIGGIIVAVISAVVGFLIKSKFFQHKFILPVVQQQREKESYKHLNGKWHLYWLSYVPSNPSDPFWMHGLQELQVDRNFVTGTTQFVGHPVLSLHSNLQGEIRAGRMIILDVCVEDETEFASVIYPNLRSNTLLVGIWNGLDNLLRPSAAPTILSRDELSEEELNGILRHTLISITPPGEYKVYQTG